MPYVEVARDRDGANGDIKLYYELHGSGPVRLVLISGCGNICHQWDLQVDFFKSLNQYTVCIFDNRGAGLSSVPKGRYKTSQMAMDTLDLLDFLRWDEFHVVGISMGGMIAQELALMCPDRIRSLTLESTYSSFSMLPRGVWKHVLSMLAGDGPKSQGLEAAMMHAAEKYLFPKVGLTQYQQTNTWQEWLDAKRSDGSNISNKEWFVKWNAERFDNVGGLQSKTGRSAQRSACLTHNVPPGRLKNLRNIPILLVAGKQDVVIRQPESTLQILNSIEGMPLQGDKQTFKNLNANSSITNLGDPRIFQLTHPTPTSLQPSTHARSASCQDHSNTQQRYNSSQSTELLSLDDEDTPADDIMQATLSRRQSVPSHPVTKTLKVSPTICESPSPMLTASPTMSWSSINSSTISQTRIKIFENAGHAIRIQCLEEYNNLLREHIDAAENIWKPAVNTSGMDYKEIWSLVNTINIGTDGATNGNDRNQFIKIEIEIEDMGASLISHQDSDTCLQRIPSTAFHSLRPSVSNAVPEFSAPSLLNQLK